MGLNHICVNSHTTNIQIKGSFKSKGQIKSGLNHNKRQGKEGDKANIDKNRSFLNEELVAGEADDIYLNIANRLTGKSYKKDDMPEKTEIVLGNGKHLRKDAVLAFEIEASYPGDMQWCMFDENKKIVPVPENVVIDETNIKDFFKMPLDRKEFNEWKEATAEFIMDKYGEQNILSMHLHMDEDEPHIHAVGVPIYTDDKGHESLSCSRFIGGPGDLAKLQTEYADHVAYLGYKRGEEFSSRISNISTKEYKARLNTAVNREMPKDFGAAKEEIKTLRMKNFELEQEMSQTMSSAKTIQKQRKRNQELVTDNKQLRQENEKLVSENQEIKKVLEMMKSLELAHKLGLEAAKRNVPAELIDKYANIDELVDKSGIAQLEAAGNKEIAGYRDMIEDYFLKENAHEDEYRDIEELVK